MAKQCSAGYKCTGTRAQILCEAGEYQNAVGQDHCESCLEQYYCEYGDPDSSGVLCLAGFYCPAGTKHSQHYPCPKGTYNDQTGLHLESQCTDCTQGYYCPFKGQTSATHKIVARYHGGGVAGHEIPDPYLCPVTAYCPEGSADAIPCPDGQWTPSRGYEELSQCMPCERGKFCRFETMFADASF